MRSRYSAYAMGLTDYILDTTDPDGPHWQPDRAAWAAEVQHFSDTTRFVSLEIVSTSEDGDAGRVHFLAGLEQGENAGVMDERSVFRRVDGRWLYTSAE